MAGRGRSDGQDLAAAFLALGQVLAGGTLWDGRRGEERMEEYVWVASGVGEIPGRDGGKKGARDEAL